MSNDSIVGRILISIVVGVVTFLVVLVIIFIISALLPGISINASFYAGILGLLAALVYFFTGRRAL